MVLIVILCAVSGFGSPVAEEHGYAWPMEAKPALTSTFGEYRKGGRLHAAIDLKTWGKEGYPVVAVSDGYVWRIRTSPWGYGRVVYLALEDGRFAIYAHLSRFWDPIAALVHAEQDRRGSYSVNMFFKPDQIPVKRGDVLGYSGRSGIGVPHMHFELRDERHRPMNPLTMGFDVVDTHPPTLKAVAFVPMDGQSTVNGRHRPIVVGLRWHKKKGIFAGGTPVTLYGRVGVALSAFDRADASALSNRLSPYRLLMGVDGREAFQTTYGEFDYATGYHGELDRSFLLRQRGYPGYHSLFRTPGNRLPFYGERRPGAGVLHAGVASTGTGVALSTGKRRLTISAEDVKANRSEARITLRVDRAPRVRNAMAHLAGDSVRVAAQVCDDDTVRVVFERSGDSGKTWQALARLELDRSGVIEHVLPFGPDWIYRIHARDPEGQSTFQTCVPIRPPSNGEAHPDKGPSLSVKVDRFPEYAILTLQTASLLSGPPSGTLRWPGHEQAALSMHQLDVRTYEVVVPFDPTVRGTADVVFTAVGRFGSLGEDSLTISQAPILRGKGGSFGSQDGGANAVFEPDGVYQRLYGWVETVMASDTSAWRPVGRIYRFLPDDVPFHSARIALRYPEDAPRPDQLGIYEQKGDGWAFVDHVLDKESRTVGTEVRHFSTYALFRDEVPPEVLGLRPRQGEVVAERRPGLRATVRDSMSGIGREEDLSMTLDGETIICEYDPEEDLLMGRPRKPLTPGPHRLRVTARDMNVNETTRETRFVVR